MDLTDHELLLRYTRDGDQAAFRELVRRHLGLVHGVALRVTRREDLAKDAAQETFIRLARRSTLLPRDITLAAWLHRTSRSLAIDLIRSENSRRKYEMKSATSGQESLPPDPDWSRLAPLIDDLVNRLSNMDRDAILLRFYQRLSYPEIGHRLGVSEEAARQRSLRAMDKLRRLLGKRGILTTSTALSLTLASHAVGEPPAMVVSAIFEATHGLSPALPHGLLSRFATMTATYKTSFAIAALILLATTAYTRPWSDSAHVQTGARSQSDTARDSSRTTGRISVSRSLPVAEQGASEKLRLILDIEDAVERRAQMVAFLDRLHPGQFEEIFDSFVKLHRRNRAAEESLLTFAWTRSDPLAAIAYGEKHGLAANMVREWASFDPDAALIYARNHPVYPASGYEDTNLLIQEVVAGIAKNNVAEALKVLAENTREASSAEKSLQMAPAEQRVAELRKLYLTMADSSDEGLDRLLEATADESLRAEIISAASSAIAMKDPVKAGRLLIDHPEAANANLALQKSSIEVFKSWTKIDPAAVADVMATGPAEIRAAALPAVTLNISDTDIQAAYGLLARCPENDYLPWVDELTGKIIQVNRDHLADKVEEFNSLPDEALRNRTTVLSLQQWMKQDASAAQAWMDSHPLPAEVRSKVSAH